MNQKVVIPKNKNLYLLFLGKITNIQSCNACLRILSVEETRKPITEEDLGKELVVQHQGTFLETIAKSRKCLQQDQIHKICFKKSVYAHPTNEPDFILITPEETVDIVYSPIKSDYTYVDDGEIVPGDVRAGFLESAFLTKKINPEKVIIYAIQNHR